MRDDAVLRADVYLPEGCDRAPVILIRQPYGRATLSMAFRQTGSFWARKGYACVVQDVRGKFSSEGVFDPMVHEADDGFDTVTWISRQNWCDGRVGMWGESYYGFTSLAAAVTAPPALRCIAPGDIATDRHKIWRRQGAFLLNTVGPWAIAMDTLEYADVDRLDSWHLPLVDMAKAAGHEGRYFRTSSSMPTIRSGGEAGLARPARADPDPRAVLVRLVRQLHQRPARRFRRARACEPAAGERASPRRTLGP
jgi:putative CocE/NonD family hydrolase